MIRVLLVCIASVGLSGCFTVAAATAGAAVGATAAVVGTTAKIGGKVVGAGVRAVVPGDSRKDEEKDED
ncbi:MAG TPA: hypothetical protein VD906_12465 [Caulobacteraceae bacterium]|nr:hypothetical protein [Caulobacteraceae bacterium]